MMEASPWALVTIGGPLLIFAVALWAWLRSRKADDELDPNTPADDPSKGMTGHD